MSKLSITIVAYNNYNYIKKAISTMEENTDSSLDKKVYIVDNSCLDESDSSLKDFLSFISSYDDVEYINTGKNLGFGQGHNYVMDMLDSQYHAIINPDIIFTEDAFSSIVAYMDENSDVGVCIPRLLDGDNQLHAAYREEVTVFDMFIRMFCRKLFPKRVAKHTMQHMDYSKPFQVPFAQGSFLVVQTSLFKELGGFDKGYFMYLEDADLCKRVNKISKVMYFPGASVIHTWEKGSHKHFTLFGHHFKSMIYYYKKWGIRWF